MMIATPMPDPYYPSRSLDLADAIEAGRKLAVVPAVLLGVDRTGAPVLHRVRIGDGGSPSLLLCGHVEDVLPAIRASVAAWYEGVTLSDGLYLTVTWPDVELIIAAQRHAAISTPMSRVCAIEYADVRGSWTYYGRIVPGVGLSYVGFHVVFRDWCGKV